MRRILVCTTLCFLLFARGNAQQPQFYLNFDQILDNREYFTPLAEHQTIFGARINPGISFGFDSVHTLRAGVNYMYEYGGDLLGVKPQIDLYYHYSTEKISLQFGSFPGREVLEYPLVLMTDSLNYYRPNLEGALVSYDWGWGLVRGWVDWMGRATEEVRETILAGVDITLRYGPLYLQGITTRYHLARSKSPDNQERIRDDGSVVLLAGADMAEPGLLDRLKLSSGYILTYERPRPADFSIHHGWFTRMDLELGILGVRGTYYLGGPTPLELGDPFYRSGNYGRLDLYVDPFRNPRITSKIGWNLHLLPGEGIFHSQQVLISISL